MLRGWKRLRNRRVTVCITPSFSRGAERATDYISRFLTCYRVSDLNVIRHLSRIQLSCRARPASSTPTSTLTWISWFCSLPGHEYFCEVAEDFIEDDFNLTGLNSMVPFWKEAMDMVLDVEPGKFMEGSRVPYGSLTSLVFLRRRRECEDPGCLNCRGISRTFVWARAPTIHSDEARITSYGADAFMIVP